MESQPKRRYELSDHQWDQLEPLFPIYRTDNPSMIIEPCLKLCYTSLAVVLLGEICLSIILKSF